MRKAGGSESKLLSGRWPITGYCVGKRRDGSHRLPGKPPLTLGADMPDAAPGPFAVGSDLTSESSRTSAIAAARARRHSDLVRKRAGAPSVHDSGRGIPRSAAAAVPWWYAAICSSTRLNAAGEPWVWSHAAPSAVAECSLVPMESRGCHGDVDIVVVVVEAPRRRSGGVVGWAANRDARASSSPERDAPGA